MEIRIIRAGQLTTVQDLGRFGFRAAGVPPGGAMDPFALRVANSLVGNPENTAALEITLVGPEIEFTADVNVALGGAESDGLPAWKPVAVRAGTRIKFGECTRGCRGYIAVSGGIDVAPVMGSRSTYLPAGFGGWEGRVLRDGDVLPLGRFDPAGPRTLPPWDQPGACGWRIDPRILPNYAPAATVRVVRGAQADQFGPGLFGGEFTVSPHSDRMGLRLLGCALERTHDQELLSAATSPGTIQVPPDGLPLVLMADAQTIGGYPQAGHVIGVDLPIMAQLRPGQTVRFVEVALEEAQRLALVRDRTLAMLREGLAEKIPGHPLP